jgi:RNA polymerase sigma factor (sigma-70 family)
MTMTPDTPDPEARAPLSESETHERLTEVFKREHRKLVDRAHRGLSRHKKDRRDEAEEIVIRAFHKVLEKIRGSVVIGNLIGYWREAVRNELSNEYRHDDMRRRTQSALDFELEKVAPSPESLCLSEEQQRLLQEASEGLPAKCRAAFRWVLWEGLTPKDVVARFAAEGIEISERQVSRYIDAGSEACRRALEVYEDPQICEDPQKEGVG